MRAVDAMEGVLRQHLDKELLRFLTCGSVDDGKSTLIGRLLYDSDQVYEDQLHAVRRDSERRGTGMDLSLLTDGLRAEREQGITIDVAFRYFSTARRKFIIADTPGHEQFTRNMATGASNCDLAVILVDARHGLLPQSRRHTYIVSLLGIKHLVLAVNKMDLVDWRQDVFDRIRADFTRFSAPLGISDVHFIPLSALEGDNVVRRSTRMPWFGGRPLLAYLETVHIASDRNLADFRFPVQRVVRPDASFRGYAGTVASGVARVGDEVVILPSGKTTRLKRIVTFDGDLGEAFASHAVTLTLDDEIDVSRGDMLVGGHGQPYHEREIEATVVWMDEKPLDVGATYWLKHTTAMVPATVSEVGGRVDVHTLEVQPAESLHLNEIGPCMITVSRPIFYDPYRLNRVTGSFILVDRLTNATAGAGVIVARHPREQLAPAAGTLGATAGSEVTAAMRASALGQAPFTVWITGLPRSGKLPIAYRLEKRLFDRGLHAYVLPASTMRRRISADLTFSADDRGVNVRRLAEMARILNDAGMIAICVAVSPYRADREMARDIVGSERFVELHASAPVEVCEGRDPDGLYAQARRGEIKAFTGISAPYEAPLEADLALPVHEASLGDLVDRVLRRLGERGLIAQAP
jgi:bifunctional enzyme CysN/CysC